MQTLTKGKLKEQDTDSTKLWNSWFSENVIKASKRKERPKLIYLELKKGQATTHTKEMQKVWERNSLNVCILENLKEMEKF